MNYIAAIVTLGGTGIGMVILANFVFYAILGEVNARSPAAQRISMFGVNTKLFLVMRRHAQLFPRSRKRLHMIVLFVAGLVIAASGLLTALIHFSS